MIKLFGDDARQFLDAIYRPNKEQIERSAKLQKDLDSIKITENDHGFTVKISDFDLSFLT